MQVKLENFGSIKVATINFETTYLVIVVMLVTQWAMVLYLKEMNEN